MARRKKNSAKTNLVISVVFHAVVVAVMIFFAAREGILGNKLKEIAVVIVPKEKPPEPPKEKPPEPKIEEPKVEEPKPIEAPKEIPPPEPAKVAATPPAGDMAPIAAPAAAVLPDFAFSDGAKIVETSTNAPVAFYKNYVEYTLRSNWERPEGIGDDNYVAEVEVRVDRSGILTGYTWQRGSGDKRWDDSVKKTLAGTKAMNRPPPKDFPAKFLVRFDVLPATEPLVQ
jgi:protein TonB